MFYDHPNLKIFYIYIYIYTFKKYIKNGFYVTIHTFKNYFVIIFSVFSKISCI